MISPSPRVGPLLLSRYSSFWNPIARGKNLHSPNKKLFWRKYKTLQVRPQNVILQHTLQLSSKHFHSSTMACIASSFAGSVAALKATKVQVSFDDLPFPFARRVLFRRRTNRS